MESRPLVQREHTRRGFSIHQKVVLELDFSGVLWGYTEITIIPTSAELRNIHLHSRQCAIHSVTVASHNAEFSHHDPLLNISFANATDAQDCHRHPELKRKIYSALQEGDEGELSIVIPREVSLRASANDPLTGFSFNEGTPEPQTPGVSQSQATAGTDLTPIVVKIDYSLRNPVDGVEFVIPNEALPYRVPHIYTTPSSPDAARCWVPCVDNQWEKCTWEFEFVVPRYLEEHDPLQDDESDLNPTIVVCSGDLVEQVAHPWNSNKTIFLFSQAVLTSVQHIGFAAGPFHLYSIPPDSLSDDTSQQPLMYAFCLPGQESLLTSSTSTLRSAMSFYSTEFGSYPFGSYKLVFVDDMPTQRFDSSTLSIISVDVLHGEDGIEQALETRHILSHALACQWVGINIQPKTWSDLWLSNGLAAYITSLFMRKLMGNNEYRFRLKKDMQRVLEWDNGAMPPICQPTQLDPPDTSVIPFVNLKAPLVLHILDRRLGKSGTSLGLSRVLPKVFLTAISGEMLNNAISTHAFLRICRKVSGVDVRAFADQWIYGSGCPAFGVSASFNRKKMAVEITMRQESPAWKMHQGNDISSTLLKPVQFFEGQMTIRIHEADGTPYEHVLDIREPFKRFDVPFNTKYKRVRRNTKRYLARQAAAQAAADGDAEAAEAMGMVDMGFGLDIWEKEKERENWKVADWTEEDEGTMSGATYEWIRMDADFEWIANLKFEQPDFMWVSQLQRDRDVVAQLEAVYALSTQPTAIVSSTLTKTVLVSNYHYRVRCEAAGALVQCAIRRLDFLGLFHLFKLFLRYCYDPENPHQDLFAHTYVPKPNDFSDLSEYFVRKSQSILSAISRIRFENGKSPPVVRQFLVDQLRYNDNTANPYSDAFYICTIISASACATVSTAAHERGELLPTEVRTEHNEQDQTLLTDALSEVDRYRSMDRLIPSYHNIVTIAALEFYLVLSVANLIPSPSRVFFPLTRYGNYTPVRIAAFDGLLLTKWYAPQIMRYMLAVMANDPSRVVRRYVARNACHSLALLVQMGEMKSNPKDTESLLIEEDGSHPERAKESKKSEMEAMIKVLRKDREVGKNEVFREFMMSIAQAPDVDHEVRWCILKLADILIRPVDENPPSVKIHIPVTPVSETPPQLPLKPHRVLKAAATAIPKSPSLAITPKLKIPIAAPDPASRASTPRAQQAPVVKSGSLVIPPTPGSLKPPKGRPPKQNTKPGGPKAQSSGMGKNDLRGCRIALKKLMASNNAYVFAQPVDPLRDNAPQYFDIIAHPMDLGTMGAKLEAGSYSNRSGFEADFRLMIANAQQYNMPNSFVHDVATEMAALFDRQWAIIVQKLEGVQLQETAPPPKPPRVIPPVPQARFSPLPQVPQQRPTIKFRVGSTATASQSDPSAKAPKVRVRPPKPDTPRAATPVDAPPPPYIDDGSHDLLQEVLAIEREKKGEHKPRHKKERPVVDGSTSKRKHLDAMSDDEDILALATPSKKDRPSPPEASGSSSARVSAPKITIKAAPSKPKKERPIEAPPAPPPSIKGKEREVVTHVKRQTPPNVVKSSGAKVPINEKKCQDILKALLKVPESIIFQAPVDPIRDGCPTYFEEIKVPMDLGTIGQKLNKHRYLTMGDFAHDVELVFSNCRQFNPPGTDPFTCADVVDKVFRKEWANAFKLSPGEKRGLQSVLSNLVKYEKSFIFHHPVDPVLLGIPTYFDIIDRKNARDLSLIKQKLDTDKYDTVDALQADLDLMIENAITFNGADSDVGALAYDVDAKAKELISQWKAGPVKKRKDGEKSNSQPAKKARLL